MSKIKSIIEQFFNHDQSEDVQKRFFQWLKVPYSQTEKECEIEHLWDEISVDADKSTIKSYKEVSRKLGFNKRDKVRSLYLKIGRIAALFIIPLLSVGLSLWYVHDNTRPQAVSLVECYAGNSEIREVILPDKSKVLLNSGSLLFYPVDFNGETRNVYLSGEAKFIVAQDKDKPFIVRTNDMDVEALGTIFNISSYPDSQNTVASLIEGKIRVDIRSNDDDYILSPNEQIVFERETANSLRKYARMDYVLAWERGQLVFQGVSLYSVMKELERRYDVTIYMNSKEFQDQKLTVKFLHDETLDEILHTLQEIITGFEYKKENNKIYISK